MSFQAIQNLATIMNGFKEMEEREAECISFMCKESVEIIKKLDYLGLTIERLEPLRGSLGSATPLLNDLYHERDQLLARFESYVSAYLTEITRSNAMLQNNHYPRIEIGSRTT